MLFRSLYEMKYVDLDNHDTDIYSNMIFMIYGKYAETKLYFLSNELA